MTYVGQAKYYVLAAFSLLHFMLNAFTFNGLGVVLPYMVEELGWTWTTAGLGFTFLGIACGLSGMMPAFLIRRVGMSRAMLIGGALLMSGFACLALTQDAKLYLLGTVLIGIGYSICGTAPGVNIISHSFKRSSTAVGLYFTAGGCGAVAGPLLAYLSQELTAEWRYYWVGAAACAVILSIFAAIVTANRPTDQTSTDTPKAAANEGWTLRTALRTSQYYVVVGAYTSFLLINTTVHGFAVQHLSESGMSMGSAATVMSIIALISAVGSTAAGMAGEKMGPRELTMLSLAATVIGVLALVAGGNWATASIAIVGLGIGFGFSYVSTAMLLLDLFGKKANLELYSAMHLFSTVAAVGPALGGFARDQFGSFSLVFICCGILGFIFLAALVWLRSPARPGEEITEDAAEPALAA